MTEPQLHSIAPAGTWAVWALAMLSSCWSACGLVGSAGPDAGDPRDAGSLGRDGGSPQEGGACEAAERIEGASVSAFVQDCGGPRNRPRVHACAVCPILTEFDAAFRHCGSWTSDTLFPSDCGSTEDDERSLQCFQEAFTTCNPALLVFSQVTNTDSLVTDYLFVVPDGAEACRIRYVSGVGTAGVTEQDCQDFSTPEGCNGANGIGCVVVQSAHCEACDDYAHLQ